MGWNDLIGQRLDRYEVIAELGRGGSSRVYRAFDPQRGGDVALKVIPNDAEDRQSFVRRFAREVKIVRQLNHPNIIEIYDSGQTDELVYLVMRCVTDGTLKQHFGRSLAVPQAVGYISQMALALHYAHERGIIHRDVKPSNMLMDVEAPGDVVLADFGIAKIQGQRGLTKSGTTIGTPEYMAPEQAEGREIDRRADIYSLGCVLYEALAGRPPFVGATPVSVLYQQVHARPSYIRGFNPDVPLELTHILERALAKDAPDRFVTAEQFAQVLRPFLSESPRAASNRMTEVPAHSPEIWTERGFLPSADAIALPAESDPGIYGGANLLFQGSPVSADTDLSLAVPPNMADAETLPPHEPPASAAPAEAPPMPGRPSTRPAIPPQPLGLPTKGSGPLPPAIAAAGGGESEAARARLESLEADTAPAEAPTLVPPGRTRAPSRPTAGPRPAAPWAASERGGARARGEVAIAEPPPWSPAGAASRSAAIFDPTTDELPTARLRTLHRSRKKAPFVVATAVAIIVTASFAGWLSYMVLSTRGSTPPHGGSPHSTAAITPSAATTPSATSAGTATPKASPATTPTTNPQAALDSEASASFRSVVLGTYPDQSCSPANGTNQFAASQSIYLNLCTSRSVASGPMTAVIRQNGVNIFTLASGRRLAPGAAYFFYSSYNLSPGSYDVSVTMVIQGHTATARTLFFTVG